MESLKEFSPIIGNKCNYLLCNRHGGVSNDQYASLNVGLAVGDDENSVNKNRVLVKAVLGLERLFSARQVHTDNIFLLRDFPEQDDDVDEFDALITTVPNVGLMIQHADCQAVLLYDPVRQAIGAIHSGWRGSVLNITGKTIQKMVDEFGCNPADMHAVISPSLGPCCAEFINYETELPASFHDYMVKDKQYHFDFWQITKMQMQEKGLLAESITLPDTCTCCSEEYFSYRRANRNGNPLTGRNGSVIALRD